MLGLFSIGQFDPTPVVLAEPKPCLNYEIEGTIDPKVELSAYPIDDLTVRQANAYLHMGDKPLRGHQVFATFVGAMNENIGEPVLLLTDDDGRVTVEVPLMAVKVAFMAESPDSGNCSGISETMNEPSVVAVTIPVLPTFDGPTGGDTGITYNDIFNPISGSQGGVKNESSDLSQVATEAGIPGELAHTGPISQGVVVLTVVVLGLGFGVGLGRGRRALGATSQDP